jgi:hypothetical protein
MKPLFLTLTLLFGLAAGAQNPRRGYQTRAGFIEYFTLENTVSAALDHRVVVLGVRHSYNPVLNATSFATFFRYLEYVITFDVFNDEVVSCDFVLDTQERIGYFADCNGDDTNIQFDKTFSFNELGITGAK